MNNNKINEQFVLELMQMQSEGLFSKIIENLPYPIAVFENSGVLSMVNKAMIKAANIDPKDISERRINFLSRVTNENYLVLEAAEDVFLGETTILKYLVEPLLMFTNNGEDISTEFYKDAVFFPVVESGGHISHGAVLLLK